MDKGLWGVRGEPLFFFSTKRLGGATSYTVSCAEATTWQTRHRRSCDAPERAWHDHSGYYSKNSRKHRNPLPCDHRYLPSDRIRVGQRTSPSCPRVWLPSGCPLAALWLLTCASAMLWSTVPLNFHPLRSSPRPGDITSAHEEEATPAQSHRAWPPSPLHRIFFSSLFGVRRRTVHT